MSTLVPARFQRFFRPNTLSTAQSAAAKTRLADMLFFRNAYLLTLTENETRRFQPRFVVNDDAKISSAACSCSPELKPNDLCRHLAIGLHYVTAGAEEHLAQLFVRSLWHEVGQLIAEESSHAKHRLRGERIETFGGDDTSPTLVTRFDGAAHSLLGCFPDEVRPRETSGTPHAEQLLRRMSVTPQEAELEKRGVFSRRQLWERSFWYAWSRAAFGAFADHDLELQWRGVEFHLTARRGGVEIDLKLPRRAVARIVERDGGELARRSAIEVLPHGVESDLALEMRDGDLHLVPVVCATLDGSLRVEKRRSLEPFRFDRWIYYPEVPALLSLKPSNDRFATTAVGQQVSLFSSGGSSGYPREIESVITAREVFRFVEKHRDEIQAMPEVLVPEPLRNATAVRLDGPATLDFVWVGASIGLNVTWKVADREISWKEVAAARSQGDSALVVGSMWIDLHDPQFVWMDALSAAATSTSTLTLTRLEYLRLRSSLRGEVRFRGEADAARFFESFESLRESGGAPSLSDLGMNLYAYQQTGYQWLWFLQENALGGLLCDDMGLGKTHQAMALVRALTDRHPESRILIVCPTSLIDHWKEKLAAYVPAVRFELHYGSSRSLTPDAQALVTSYGTLRNDIERFADRRFDLVIVDEAQVMKNRSSQIYGALARLQRSVAIGLTGTPVENRLAELRTLLDYVVPGYLPGETQFERAFVRPIETFNDVGARERLHRLIHPFVLRRTKAQVLPELPPKIIDVRHCELTPAQKEVYRDVLTGRARKLREQLATGQTVSYLHVFAVLNHLKQVCNHPMTYDSRYALVESGKWNAFTELLDSALESGLKVVVFSQYLRMLKMIEHYLDERSIAWATIKGDTRDRGAMVERFRTDPECRVFTASLRAGGLGIDLTAASVVIHYDRWWNQSREDQATDRVHRLGQNRGVQVIKLITKGTLEEKIDRIIARKAQLASELVREDDPTLVKQFSRDELASMLEGIED